MFSEFVGIVLCILSDQVLIHLRMFTFEGLFALHLHQSHCPGDGRLQRLVQLHQQRRFLQLGGVPDVLGQLVLLVSALSAFVIHPSLEIRKFRQGKLEFRLDDISRDV